MQISALNDEVLHQQALAVATKEGISYVEALGLVRDRLRYPAASAQFSEQACDGGFESNHQAYDALSAYAAHHRVSFSEACVAYSSRRREHREVQSFQQRRSHAHPDVVNLHIAALQHSIVHSVSYAESLTHVGPASVAFGEGAAPAMSLQAKAVEVFRSGRHVSEGGDTHTFSAADVAAIARSYDPAVREAPLTIGHPASDLPAYGWVKSLSASPDGRLDANFHQVDPAFAELVSAGRYKKRSAAFYPPGHHSNPTPGQWYLRHVAWLGAQPPAISGLRDHSFADTGGAVSFTL